MRRGRLRSPDPRALRPLRRSERKDGAIPRAGRLQGRLERAAPCGHRSGCLHRAQVTKGQRGRCLVATLVAAGKWSHPRFARWLRLSPFRSEEHTSELQSLMRISYAVFCLKKKTYNTEYTTY